MAAKDYLEKQLLRYADVFADVLNVCLFGGKRLILAEELVEAATLSIYKDKTLKFRMQERDLAKYWDKCNIRIAFFGIEDQTNVSDIMPLRVIGYDGAVYRDEVNNILDAKEENRKQKEQGEPVAENDKRRQIYPVISVILYFDYKKKWTGPRSLKECFKNMPPELEPYVNDYKIHVIDVAWLPDETIAKFTSDFRFVAEYFSQMQKENKWKPMPEEIKHVRDLLYFFEELTKDNRFIEMYKKYEKDGGDATMASIALDYLEQNGYDRGVKDGKLQGFHDGKLQGFHDGETKGRKDGRDDVFNAMSMIKQNTPLSDVSKTTGIDISRLQSMRDMMFAR